MPANPKKRTARSARIEAPRKKAAGIQIKNIASLKQSAGKAALKGRSKIAGGRTVTIVCRLESFRDGHARCWAEISGARVPIDLPAAVLRLHGIEESSWFTWSFSERLPMSKGRPKLLDGPPAAPALTPDQEEEIERLFQEAIEAREQGLWAALNDQ